MTTPNSWDSFDEAPEETRREGLPVMSRKERGVKSLRRYVWFSSLAFVPLLFLTLFLAASTYVAQPATSSSVGATLSNDQALERSLVLQEVTTWLNKDPSPLPNTRIVGWDGLDTVPAPAKPQGPEQEWPEYRTHRVSVVQTLKSGHEDVTLFYTVSVTIADDGFGPAVVGKPSALPAPTPAERSDIPMWPGGKATEVSNDVQVAVKSWAEAFSSGDSAKLRVLVGDSSSEHFYQPLPGVEVIDVTVAGAMVAPWEKTDSDKPISDIVVRANLSVRWNGQGATQTFTPMSYDLLVVGANTAAPRVIAWGGAGSGPNLKAGYNALTGVPEVVAPSLPPEEPEPTPTPTPTPSEEKQPSQPAGEGGDNGEENQEEASV